MRLHDPLTRALERLESLCAPAVDGAAHVFTWHGVDLPCVPMSLSRTVEITSEGNPINIDFVLFVRRSHFRSADENEPDAGAGDTADHDLPVPVTGKTCRFRGHDLRILTVKHEPTQAALKLSLAHPASNR